MWRVSCPISKLGDNIIYISLTSPYILVCMWVSSLSEKSLYILRYQSYVGIRNERFNKKPNKLNLVVLCYEMFKGGVLCVRVRKSIVEQWWIFDGQRPADCVPDRINDAQHRTQMKTEVSINILNVKMSAFKYTSHTLWTTQ